MLSTRELERQISEICQHIPILGTDSVPDLLFPFYVKIRRTVPIFTQPLYIMLVNLGCDANVRLCVVFKER